MLLWVITSALAAELGPPVIHTSGLFVGMRTTEAVLWPEPFARPRDLGWRYQETLTTAPTFDPKLPFLAWDGDPPLLNVVGHGLLGLELYSRPRQCGFEPVYALGFAAVASAVWEYGFEGSARVPSAQDLLYTPLAGILLGELRYHILARSAPARSRGKQPLLRWVLDPLGEAERALGARC